MRQPPLRVKIHIGEADVFDSGPNLHLAVGDTVVCDYDLKLLGANGKANGYLNLPIEVEIMEVGYE